MSNDSLVKDSQISNLNAWVLAARPKTLTASFIPILAATSLAITTISETNSLASRSFPWRLGLLALVCALLIQIGTNFINDALDFRRGADSKDRLGPRRAVASGLLDFKSVLKAGIFCFIFALIFGVPLVQSGGIPILVIGLFSILFGYLYTGGPRPLAYTGLGDLFVLIFFGWIAVGGLFYLYCGFVTTDAIIAGTQIGLLATSLIVINNIRDYKGDLIANKFTLVARYGVNWGRNEIRICFYMPYLLLLYWIYNRYIFAGLLPLITLPIALEIIRDISLLEPCEDYNKFLGKAALLHLIFGVLLSFGLIIDSNF